MTQSRNRLLLTAAGTGTSYSYSLAKAKYFPNVQLVTVDTNPADLVTSSLFADAHVVIQAFEETGYLAVVNEVIRRHRVSFYLPIIDEEIAFAASAQEDIECDVISNSASFCEAAVRKSEYANLVDNVLIKAPTRLTREEYTRVQRAVAKKDRGFGGRVTIVKDGSGPELDESWQFYEYLEGSEYTVDCFPLGEDVVTSVRERIAIKSGVCTKARIVQNEAFHNYAAYLVQRFKLRHPFCFQTICQEGQTYLIDLNPRLGAGSAMSAVNGMDFFAAHLALITGEDPRRYLNRYSSECVVTRQYCEYMMTRKL